MGYSHQSLIRTLLITTVLLSLPKLALSHVGHGDEFQATGGIERVAVNPEMDQMLGIVITPIAPATDGSASILVPVTALVSGEEQQLVFVPYQNFYELVPVTTGATQGELIEVIEGLSVGENLVTQGSLSLYAESRKTQTPETAATAEAIATGAGNEIVQPLAIVVLGGLFTSTALTLLVIPALYAQFGKRLMPQPKPAIAEIESGWKKANSMPY